MTQKIFLVAAIALGVVPVLAHSHPEGSEKIERVVIMNEGAKAKDGQTRSFHIRRGADGLRDMAFADCGGDATKIEEGEGKEKTRIFLCTNDKLSGEERAKKLEEIRAKMAQNDHLSAGHRAKVEAALQEAINRARAGK